MTDFSIELPTDLLRAAMLCVSSSETRYYLKGVSIEPELGGPRIVSTDGHILFAARFVGADLPGDKFIVPIEALDKAMKGHKLPWFQLSRAGAIWTAGDVRFDPIDGTFPHWRLVIPKAPSDAPVVATYDPDYLALMKKAARLLGGKGSTPSIYQNGENPALVTFGERRDCVGVVMPVRDRTAPKAEELHDLVRFITFQPAP
jgi:hypothetical protein